MAREYPKPVVSDGLFIVMQMDICLHKPQKELIFRESSESLGTSGVHHRPHGSLIREFSIDREDLSGNRTEVRKHRVRMRKCS